MCLNELVCAMSLRVLTTPVELSDLEEEVGMEKGHVVRWVARNVNATAMVLVTGVEERSVRELVMRLVARKGGAKFDFAMRKKSPYSPCKVRVCW